MIKLGLLLAASALSPPPNFRPLPECTPASQEPCIIHHDWDPKDLEIRLGSHDWTWWVDRDQLTVVSRLEQYPWLLLCCDVQTPLERIGNTGLVGITVAIPAMDRAVLQIIPAPRPGKPAIIRGPAAPRELERSAPLKGNLFTRTIPMLEKGHYQKLSIYVPPNIGKATKIPVLYLADDLAVDFAPIAEHAIIAGDVRPVILVGIAAPQVDLRCDSAACDQRSEEYLTDSLSTGQKANRTYERYKSFFLNKIVPYIEKNYPVSQNREDRCLGGASNGASWALTMVEGSPERFGCVMALSSGSRLARDSAARLKNVKVSVGYGTLDVKFASSTKRIAEAARSNGVCVREYSVVAGHSAIAWEYLFADIYPSLFSKISQCVNNNSLTSAKF